MEAFCSTGGASNELLEKPADLHSSHARRLQPQGHAAHHSEPPGASFEPRSKHQAGKGMFAVMRT